MRFDVAEQTVAGPRQGPTAAPSLNMGTIEHRATAEGAAQVSRLAAEIGAMSRDANNAMEKATRLMQAQRDYGTWYAERALDPEGWETLQSDSVAKMREVRAAAMDGVTDSRLQGELHLELERFSVQGELNAQSDSRKQLVERNTGRLNGITTEMRRAAGMAPDDEATKSIVMQTLALIESQRKTGIISEKDAVARKNTFMSGVAEDRIRARLMDDPGAILLELGDPKQHPYLDVDTRNTLMKLADNAQAAEQRAADTADRRALALEEREIKARQAEGFGLYYSMGTELTEQMVLDGLAGNTFSPDVHFPRLMDMARANAFDPPGTPMANRNAINDAYMGKLDVSQVIGLNAAELISNETRDKAIVIVKGSPFFNTPAWREASSQFEAAMGVFGDVIPHDAGPLLVEGRRELWERVQQGADPLKVVYGSGDDPGLIARYSIDFSTALPDPIYETMEELNDAFRAGKISQTDIGRQIKLLDAHKAASKAEALAAKKRRFGAGARDWTQEQ